MTRINANIKIQTLCDAHLLAEHREITRIPEHLMNDWTATEEDNNIVLERITERLSGMKNKKHTSYV